MADNSSIKYLEINIKISENCVRSAKDSRQPYLRIEFERILRIGKILLENKNKISNDDINKFININANLKKINAMPPGREKEILVNGLNDSILNLELYLAVMYDFFDKEYIVPLKIPKKGYFDESNLATMDEYEYIAITPESVNERLIHLQEVIDFFDIELIFKEKDSRPHTKEKYDAIIKLHENTVEMFSRIKIILGDKASKGIVPEDENLYRTLINSIYKIVLRSYALLDVYREDFFEELKKLAKLQKVLNDNLVQMIIDEVKKI